MKFQLFRYYLTPTQLNISFSSPDLSKGVIMKKVLSENFDFTHFDKEFSYIPVETIFDEKYVIAQIGRKKLRPHDFKESDKFFTKKEEEWPYRYLVFDTNEKSQIVAFEISKPEDFSYPLSVLKWLTEQINEKLSEFGWHIEFEPIIDTHIFWNIVKKNEGNIRSVKFTYFVPNLFGVNDKLNEDLENAKKVYAAQKVETELINTDGHLVVPETPFAKESIAHITKGGGKYVLTLRNKRKYRSEDLAKTTNIEETELKTDDKELIMKIISKIFEN